MKQGEKSNREIRQRKKQASVEASRIDKEQERKKSFLAREQAIEKASDARKTKRQEQRTTEEAEQQAREQERRRTYLAREKNIADAHEARKPKP